MPLKYEIISGAPSKRQFYNIAIPILDFSLLLPTKFCSFAIAKVIIVYIDSWPLFCNTLLYSYRPFYYHQINSLNSFLLLKAIAKRKGKNLLLSPYKLPLLERINEIIPKRKQRLLKLITLQEAIEKSSILQLQYLKKLKHDSNIFFFQFQDTYNIFAD